MTYKKIITYSTSVILILFLSLFLIRFFLPKHLDDLHPDIPCDEALIKKVDLLAVIPKYNNIDISKNKEWCGYVASFNKTLLMHGVYHTYNEFNTPRKPEYIQQGVTIFKDCFGYAPEKFKASQLALSNENKNTLKEKFNLKIYAKFTQFFHKAYHCNDSGLFPNWVIDLI